MYLQLFLVTLSSVLVSVAVYLLQQKTAFGKWHDRWQQLVIGLVFGAAAVLGTEFGVPYNGVIINARDAAPLCAGLLFGGPAGIIAGAVGGVERWFCVLWGGGMYSRIACSVSTLLAGIYAAALRRYMFDNKRPTWGFGLAVGTVLEVIQMTILFLTHARDAAQAYEVVKVATGPMVVCNALSVTLAIAVISRLSLGVHREKIPGYATISQKVQGRLLLCFVVAYFATTSFVYILQTNTARADSEKLLRLNLEDVRADVSDTVNEQLLDKARSIKSIYLSGLEMDLDTLADRFEVTEINVVNSDGIIMQSTEPDYIGFDMNSGEQSRAFMALTDGEMTLTQEFQNISFAASDSSLARKYVGISLPNHGFIQVGINAEQMQETVGVSIRNLTANRRIGESGYILIADRSFAIVSNLSDHTGQNLLVIGPDSESYTRMDTILKGSFYDTPCYWMYSVCEGYYIVAVMPVAEATTARDNAVYLNSFMEVLVFAVLFALIYFLIKRLVVNNIRSVNRDLSNIIGGDLNITVDVRGSEEFSSLSDDINSAVSTLKRYIAEADERIDTELAFARNIQHSALPSVFPAFPDMGEFDIYATMDTAREVGGDFYDFYMPDKTHLVILIADVSGKGIPAAMFMMTAKTMLKSLTETGRSLEQVFVQTNENLCAGNEADMFVTAWMGIIDLVTGHLDFVNAGHNPPLIYHRNAGYSYLRTKANLVLAAMNDVSYTGQSLELQSGDKIFLYTDGVPEATNRENELYGEIRLSDYLNAHVRDNPKELLNGVRANVSEFAGEAEQLDDMTMLCVEYKKRMAP